MNGWQVKRSDPWPMARVERVLGADHVARIRALPHPVAHCEVRAQGWWDANDPDYYAAYVSLAAHLSRRYMRITE